MGGTKPSFPSHSIYHASAVHSLPLWLSQLTSVTVFCSSLAASLHALLVTLSARHKFCSSLFWSPFLALMHVRIYKFFTLILKVCDVRTSDFKRSSMKISGPITSQWGQICFFLYRLTV